MERVPTHSNQQNSITWILKRKRLHAPTHTHNTHTHTHTGSKRTGSVTMTMKRKFKKKKKRKGSSLSVSYVPWTYIPHPNAGRQDLLLLFLFYGEETGA